MKTNAPMARLPLWVYVLVNTAEVLLWLAALSSKGTGLLRERLRPGPGAREDLSTSAALLTPLAASHYIVAGLDRRHPRWSGGVPPLWAQIAGLAISSIAAALGLWASAENPFFSKAVRVQADRGQYVVTTGPYRYVRHPGYAASIGFFLGSGFALGSWLSLIPALAWVVAIVRRTALEDAVLHQGLPGYVEYARRVRYRLVPGLW